ncbi:MAG: TonB-dependent siderophore receptor [Rhodocyclaceae bacterium]|nr:TonB-dependent siderophore receptor [Rhodocyclaceae bacterium]
MHAVSPSLRPLLRRRLLPLAVAAALGGLAALPAYGQGTTPAAVQQFSLPAQPLGQALNALARQSGVAVSADSALVAGKTAPALQGTMTLREALQRVLAGSGLVAESTGSAYTVRTAGSPGGGTMLAPLTVTAQADRATTEGSDSYTTRSMQTATRLPLSIRETPQSVSVMTRQRMEDQGLMQLPDVIQQTTGLIMAKSGDHGSDSSPIYARGFIVENYQVDGISHLHSSYTYIFQSSDMAIFDRAEVVRGATGLMNGIGTPSATINLIRKKPTAEFQGYIKAEGGSWDRYRLEADASSPLNAAGTLRGRGVVAWQENGSSVDRFKEEKNLAYGIVEADLTPDTLLSAGITYQRHRATGNSRYGLPLFNSDGAYANWQRSDSAAASWAYSRRENLAAFAALEHRFANEWRVKGTYSYDSTKYDEQMGYADGGFPDKATGEGVMMTAGRWASPPVQHSMDVYAGGPFTLLGRKHDLVLGVMASSTKEDSESYYTWHVFPIPNIYRWDGSIPGRPDSSATGDSNYKEKTRSAYVTARFKPFDPLSVIVGARTTTWEDRKYTRPYASGIASTVKRKWSDQVTPYVGIVFDLSSQWSVYASYTDIFKPQSNRKDVSGNYIDPLLGQVYEIGTKAELFDGRLNLAAAVYDIKQDNLAVRIPGVFAPDGTGAYRAAQGTKTNGFEVELGGQIAPNWQASVGFARNLSRDADRNLLNTDIPQNTLKLFSTYRMPWVGNGLTVGGGLRWQNRTEADFSWAPGSPKVKQEAYALVDLMARYDITRHISASFNAYNLFDKSYLSTPWSAYYGEPRSFRLGLTYRF